MGKTIEKDGYFFYSWDCNAYNYSYEKIESGLVDLYVYGGLQEAIEYLKTITVWAEKNLPRFRNPAKAPRELFTGGGKQYKRNRQRMVHLIRRFISGVFGYWR